MHLGPSINALPVRRRTKPAAAAQSVLLRQRYLSGGEKQVVWFVVCCFVLQLGLFALGNTSLRLPLRIGAYALSLMMLFLTQRTGQMHPAAKMMQYVVAILLIGFINPAGDRIIARVAQICLYLAVLAPLLWASRQPMQLRAFRLVLLAFWLFYTASAALGAVQVHYPGRFDGALSENYEETNMAGNTFELANGQKFLRPKGLTDTPGGAATGGVNSLVLSFGLLLTERRMLMRLIPIPAMICDLYCIYLCEGRTNLIIVALVAISLLAVLMRRGSYKKATWLASVTFGVAFVGSTIAFASGGQAVVDRFFTSVSDDPRGLVYNERGRFLEDLVERDALTYFLGAGQGRWGMMHFYFGGKTTMVWAEMMWQALLYDGGVPLIVMYAVLLGMCLSTAWKIALTAASEDLSCWAGVVFGLNIAAIAASFVFPIFSVQMGLEVFLINGCLFATARRETAPAAPARRSDFPRRMAMHWNRSALMPR